MKKNIVLAMIVLAILVAPAFAEPAFHGEASYSLVYEQDKEKNADGTQDDKQWEDLDNNASVKFDAELDEFTTLSAEIKGDEGKAVEVETMILSQDLTGFLGIEGPVSFSYKLGKQEWKPQDYGLMKDPDAHAGLLVEAKTKDIVDDNGFKKEVVKVCPVEGGLDFVVGDDSNMVGFVATIGIMDALNIDVAVYPTTYLNEAKNDSEFGVNVYGTFGSAKVSAYYTQSVPYLFVEDTDDDDAKDDKGDMLGFNAEYAINDAFLVSALVETRLADEITVENLDIDFPADATTFVALAGSYTMDGLVVKLGADVSDLGADKIEGADKKAEDWNVVDALDVDLDVEYTLADLTLGFVTETSLNDFAVDSNAKVTAKYAIADATLFASAKMKQFKDFKAKDHLEYDLGASYAAGAVTFTGGYTENADTLDILDDDHEKGFFFQVKASF